MTATATSRRDGGSLTRSVASLFPRVGLTTVQVPKSSPTRPPAHPLARPPLEERSARELGRAEASGRRLVLFPTRLLVSVVERKGKGAEIGVTEVAGAQG